MRSSATGGGTAALSSKLPMAIPILGQRRWPLPEGLDDVALEADVTGHANWTEAIDTRTGGDRPVAPSPSVAAIVAAASPRGRG